MRHLSGLFLIGALLLSGCASSPDVAEVSTPSAIPTAESAPASSADIRTLEDGLTYARSLSADIPDLADEMSKTATTLTDLVVEAELPWDVNNSVNRALITLNAAVLREPASAASQLSELNRIVDEIDDAL